MCGGTSGAEFVHEKAHARPGRADHFRIVKRLAPANSQRPPGSYAERPLGQTAGVLRFHSSLEGLTDKGAFCSGNYSEQFYTDTTQSSDLSLPGFGKSRADHSFEAYREFN